MFGHNPIDTKKVLTDIVRSNNADEGLKYGVFYDEMSALLDEEDFFDAGVGGKPDPAILELATCHVPLCEIPLDPDYEYKQTTKPKRSLNRKVQKLQAREDPNAQVETDEQTDARQNMERTDSKAKGTFTVNQAAYNMIRPGYTVVLYGPRRSGKSKLIKNICQRMRHLFPEVVVFTMTKASAEYFSYVPYERVIEGLDEDLLGKIIDHQMERNAARSRGEDVGNTNVLIIIDDCMAEGLRFKKTFNQLFYNGRHSNITLLVAVQDVRGIAPSATINADLVCTFSLPDKRGRDTIREKFADYLTDTEFDNLYESEYINKKYHVVWFDIAHRYNPLDKRISFGCVDPDAEQPFVLGDRAMWTSEDDNGEKQQQLIDLGFERLLNMPDWGIVKPAYVDRKKSRRHIKKAK